MRIEMSACPYQLFDPVRDAIRCGCLGERIGICRYSSENFGECKIYRERLENSANNFEDDFMDGSD